MGVDLGIRQLIATSAYYGWGDSLLDTIKNDFEGSKRFICEQIPKGSIWLYNWSIENDANVIVLENLNFSTMKADKNMVFVLKNLWDYIRKDSHKYGIRVELVSPQYTSQICSNCGRKGIRDTDEFRCPYNNCHITENADVNGAKNVGARYIFEKAFSDIRQGKKLWDSYYLAVFRKTLSIRILDAQLERSKLEPLLNKYNLT
jgi:IS605 OrfB family transposase